MVGREQGGVVRDVRLRIVAMGGSLVACIATVPTTTSGPQCHTNAR